MPVIPGPYANYSIELTGKLIIIDALDLLGANDAVSEPELAVLKRDQRTLNMMLDSWNNERLVIYALTQFTGATVSATQDYLIGSNQPFDTFAPVKIEQGEAFLSTTSGDFGLTVLTAEEWGYLRDKETASGRPRAIYYEPGTTAGTISFYPNPDDTYTFLLFRRELLSQITNINEIFYLPPGYAEAITNHLAVRLAPKQGRQVPAEVLAVANEAKANLKRINMQPMEMRCDDALISRGHCDIYSGDFR